MGKRPAQNSSTGPYTLAEGNDAALAMLAFELADLQLVEVNKATQSMMQYSEPTNGHEARFSFEGVLGVAILDGNVWLPALTDSSVSSQRYRDAGAKVKVIFHPEWSPVTIRLQKRTIPLRVGVRWLH